MKHCRASKTGEEKYAYEKKCSRRSQVNSGASPGTGERERERPSEKPGELLPVSINNNELDGPMIILGTGQFPVLYPITFNSALGLLLNVKLLDICN